MTRDASGEDPKTRTLGAASTPASVPNKVPEEGTTLGRYHLLEAVGHGGMGAVYRAYDPKLRREVALKIVYIRAEHSSDSAGAELRIVREAHAMAQLTHPNVVPVYDVDTVGSTVFITMEYVEGQTLRQWVRQTDPAWRDVIKMFCAAGEGLAAAHDAGIIHRDFKPSNVIVGEDGRARVLDFGLARAGGEPSSMSHSRTESSMEHDSIRSYGGITAIELTQAGAVLGTPVYMAPEQHRGHVVDARADQFSFCVALFESLYGVRPFRGTHPSDLLAQKLTGEQLPSSSPKDEIPTWFYRVVRCGLSPRPDDRFATMHVLLQELVRDPTVRRRRWVKIGATVALSAATGGAVYLGMARPEPCTQAHHQLDGVWDEPQRQALKIALLDTGYANAQTTMERVLEHVNTYAQDWSEGYTQACMATHVEQTQSGEALELRMACLSQRRRSLQTLIDLLTHETDGKLLHRAVPAVASLPKIDRCADVPALRKQSSSVLSPVLMPRVNDAMEQLAEARSLYSAGKYERAAKQTKGVLDLDIAQLYPPLRARALDILGRSLGELDDAEQAVDPMRQAYYLAIEAQDSELAYRSSSHLVFLLAERLRRPDEAEDWVKDAQAWLLAAGKERVDETALLSNLARLRLVQGRPKDGLELYRKVLALRLASEIERVPVVMARHNVAVAEYQSGDYDAALRSWSEALVGMEATLGEHHPRVADAANNIAAVYLRQERLDKAQQMFERALQIRERAFEPSHPVVATTLNNLGMVMRMKGEHDRAQALHQRALEIWETKETPSPHLPDTLSNLAAVAFERARFDEAEALYRRALEVATALQGPDHPDLAWSLNAIGSTLVYRERFDEAIPLFERAIAVRQGALGPDHPFLSEPLYQLAQVLQATGRRKEATVHLDRALKIMNANLPAGHKQLREGYVLRANMLTDGGQPKEALEVLDTVHRQLDAKAAPDAARLDVWFAQARAYAAIGEDRAAARRLGRQALTGHQEQPVVNEQAVRQIEEFLRELG